MKRMLKTDRDFLSLSIPLLPEQEMELEKSLMRDGCREPIIVWNGVIIDGHKRYRICEDECIEYEVEELTFSSAAEAVSWVCRRKIPEQVRMSTAYRYLVGKLYLAQKQIFHEEQKLPESSRTVKLDAEVSRVSHLVGNELNLNRATVERFGMRANDLDQIAEKDWQLFEALLSGKAHLTFKEMKEYAAMSERKLRELCKTKWNLDEARDKSEKIRNRNKKENVVEPAMEIPLSVKIKEMPAYDPDMEVRGLTLTIPAWITAIGRVEKKTGQATDMAKVQLSQSLTALRDKIDALLITLNDVR